MQATIHSKYHLTVQHSTGEVRIRAGIDWNFNLAQDWTHIGNSTFINGSIFDDVYGTPVLDQNITQYTISMISPSGNVDIAQGFVDNNTSTFSQQIIMQFMLSKLVLISIH